ncbi:helix-turn-helix domain-containing protein [Paraburkholderia sp. Cpub6]|uniref:helix-turn-helix domain-containing protein n=1 Tax=Paraburkholderia sp. Cpub6 TaxID=2723094 RepID=UPI001614567D|nr:helix-turn-helix domain-containing protein [Paraburkholderia sp. Cpub6]MBB5460239.1 excisionase family DNA binding protein [Paraburkholderia sp. Cpub6]
MSKEKVMSDNQQQEPPTNPIQVSDGLTIEQAARLLFVSQAHVRTLLADGTLIGARTTQDGDVRIPRATVLSCKTQIRAVQQEGLDRMIGATDRMGLYDAEAADIPKHRKK